MTRKSAKYSTMDLTTSWSSASASRSSADFLTMLLKSVSVRIQSSGWGVSSGGERTDMVFAILGLSKLVNQELDAVWRGSKETEAAQMSHLFPVLIVQALREVDGVI
jgi:hypothetical protein